MDILRQMVLMASVMIVFVILLRQLLLYRLPKRTFLWLWALVLLRLFLPVYVSSPLSLYSLLPRQEAGVQRAIVAEPADPDKTAETRRPDGTPEAAEPEAGGSPSVSAYEGNLTANKGNLTANEGNLAANEGNLAANEGKATAKEGKVTGNGEKNAGMTPAPWESGMRKKAVWSWLPYAVWLAGTFGMALYFLITHFRAVREYRTSLPVEEKYAVIWLWKHPGYRNIRIRQSDRIRAPITYGVLRPVILMPAGLDWSGGQAVEPVLLHELCHIRHLDVLYRWILAAALCVYWWDPFVWAMYVLAGRDMELACDEEVVKKTGDTKGYAQLLLSMQVEKNLLEPVCSHFSRHAVTERIRALAKGRALRRLGSVLGTALVILTAGVFWTHSVDAAGPLGVPAASEIPSWRLAFFGDSSEAENDGALIGGPLGGLHGKGGFYEDKGYSWMYGGSREEGEASSLREESTFLFPEELNSDPAAVAAFTALGAEVDADGGVTWQGKRVRILDASYVTGQNSEGGYYYSGDRGEVDLRVVRDYSGCRYDEKGRITPEAPVKEVRSYDLGEDGETQSPAGVLEGWVYDSRNPGLDDELDSRYLPLGIVRKTGQGPLYEYQGKEVRVFVDLYLLDPRHVRNSNKAFTLSTAGFGSYDIVILRDYDTPGEDGHGKIEGFKLYDLKRGTVTFVYTGSMEKVQQNGRTWYLPDSEADLLAIGSSVYPLDGSYRLQRDIVMTSEWTALGTREEPFTGEFDGGGHTIYNLTITKEAEYVGMFGLVRGAQIHDFDLASARIEAGGKTVGGVCAVVLDGTRVENVNIR